MKKLSQKSNRPKKSTTAKTANLFWATKLLLFSALAFLFPQFILSRALFHFLGQNLTTPLWLTIYTLLSAASSLAIVLLLFPKLTHKKPLSRDQIGLSGLPTWTDILLSPIAFIVYFIIATLFTALFSLFPWFNPHEVQNVGFSGLILPLDRLLAFFSLVIIAPIVEEILFRGWLYGLLRSRLSLIPSMLIVSSIFAILHGQLNVGLNVFVLSLALCFQRELTGTIYSSILLHIIKNFLAFWLLFLR